MNPKFDTEKSRATSRVTLAIHHYADAYAPILLPRFPVVMDAGARTAPTRRPRGIDRRTREYINERRRRGGHTHDLHIAGETGASGPNAMYADPDPIL